MLILRALSVWLLLVQTPVFAADVVYSFDNDQQSDMYHSLLKEYRCLKCQNQNLADSHASLAGDLRREIRDKVIEGKSKQDIDQYLVDRYGEFVLYRPRFSAKTAILWIAPFVLLILALGSVFFMVQQQKKRMGESGEPLRPETDEERSARLAKAKRLLSE